MARRLIEDDLNKKKRKPTASISTIQNVARQVKSAPVKRQTMNLQTNRATAKPSVQKQARPRPMERKTFEAPPTQKTEPASNYFTRVDTGRTPEQQKRHDIMVNAVREYEGNPSALYDPAAPQKAVKFAGQSTENIYSGLTRNIGNAAFGGGDIRLMGRQDYNANRENERTREAGLPTEWLTEVNVDPNEFRDNALYQTMMSQAKEHENEMTPTTWGNLMQNFGYNLPGGAAAVALAPLGEIGQRAGNLGMMGLASYGAGLEEKLNEGYDEKYARRYGLANALNETLFQESIDPFHGQLGVTPYTLQNVLGEFVQEGAGEAVSPYMDLVLRDYDSLGDFGRAAWDITKDQVLNLDYLRNIFKAAEMGALGAGINSLMTNPVGTYRQAVEDATTLADNVQSAIDQRNSDQILAEIVNTPARKTAVLSQIDSEIAFAEQQASLGDPAAQTQVENLKDTKGRIIDANSLRQNSELLKPFSGSQLEKIASLQARNARVVVEGKDMSFDEFSDEALKNKNSNKVLLMGEIGDEFVGLTRRLSALAGDEIDLSGAVFEWYADDFRHFAKHFNDGSKLATTKKEAERVLDIAAHAAKVDVEDDVWKGSPVKALTFYTPTADGYEYLTVFYDRQKKAILMPFDMYKHDLGQMNQGKEKAKERDVWMANAPQSLPLTSDNGPSFTSLDNNIAESSDIVNEQLAEPDYGYHYGTPEIDLVNGKKSERLFQRPGRGTGAFGTGMYFFGEGRNNSNESGFKNGRTEHKVDFSDYNLYKPNSSKDAYDLHAYFKLLDDTYDTDPWHTSGDYERGIGAALNKARQYAETLEATEVRSTPSQASTEALDSKELKELADLMGISVEEAQELSEAISKEVENEINGGAEYVESRRYMDDDMVQDVVNSLREVEDDATIEKIIREATVEDGKVDADLLAEAIETYTEDTDRFNMAEKISQVYDDADHIADMLGVDRTTFNQAVEDALRTAREDAQDPGMHQKNYDSLGTRVMKALGYEGIDVRHLKELDNSAYGSVIYDVKPETLDPQTRMEKAINAGDMTAAEEATRDAVNEIFNDELADQPQDEATARLRQSIEDDINIRLNDIAPNQTMEKVAKGELNASKTARDTAQIGLERETNDVEHVVHHKNDFMKSSASRRESVGSFKEFFDQIMANPMMDQTAPVGTIYRGNPISTAIARGKQFAENLKNARAGRAEEELYAHMTDLEYAINESTTIEEQIEREAAEKGITLEVLPAPMGKTIVRAYGADGVALDTDEAKEFVRRLDEQRAMTEALRKERAGIGSVGGTILNYMKEGDAANMTPASQLEVLQLAVDGINNDLQAKLRKKFKKGLLSPITISQEFKNKFLDFDTTQETRSEMVNDFLKAEARKYPHTVVEQIDNFRYGNMLFRTTTWIRNKGGNELGQGMYNAKNVTAYFLERWLEMRGKVADYNVDLENEADQQFVLDSYNAIENKLSNDIAENKNIKDHSDRVKKFRELGYTGSLLTEMANYRGETYNTKMNADKLGKVAQQLVTNYKNSGVTDFASADPAEFTKQMVEAYNQNEKQLINREDLRHTTAEGKMAKGDTALAKELWKEQFSEAAKKNSKTTNIKRKSGLQGAFYDEYNSRPFTIGQTLFNTDSGPVSALLNKRNDITDFMMNEAEFPIIGRFGDQPFQRDRWAKSFASRLASQGYELAKNDKGQFIIKDHNLRDSQEIIRKYGQEAALEAAESVYRDDNKWADLVNDAREISLTGKIILDANLAFTRTPFNIFRRAIEYSPIGFAKSMNNLRHVKDGSMTASQWIDDTAKGLTGTGLFALGVVLAEAGIITGDRNDEDDEEKKYRNTLGMNDYSLVIPDELGGGTYSLDWAAPSVSAVLCGAQLVQIFNTMVPHKEGETLTDYLKRASGEVPGALWSLAQPILDTTMMQNLLDTMASLGDADRNTVETIAENYAGQFTGSMGASLRKVWDDTARSTYSDNFYDRLLRQARNKSILVDAGTKLIQKMTTGESHDLEPQLDSKGNEIKNVGGNMAGRFLYNMISPGTYKSDTEDKTDTELLRLYNSKDVGSNSDLLPAQLYKLKLDGQQYKFTPEERTELNKYYLQGMRSAVEKYMSSSLYRQQSDKERADTIQKIQDYYYTKVKEQYFSKVAPGEAKDMVKGINRTADVLSKSLGINLYQAFGLGNVEGVKGHDGQTISNSRAMEARNYLEAIGVDMDDVKKLVDSGKLKYADLGLTEKVASWTPTEFRDNVHDLEDGLYGSERVYTLLGDGAKMDNDQIDHLRSLESDKDEKGETIRNSRAYKAKEYLMEIGVYDDVVKMINEGKLEPGDVYLNKTVMGSAYKYRGGSGSGSSSRKSSGGGSSRKRSSTTDMDKVYQKLYKMAMSGTMDSIGDLASQLSRQAQMDYGPKSQTTNHEALINELEKMVSQQQRKPR